MSVDPDDSSGVLDLAEVRTWVRTVPASGQRLLEFKLITYDTWTTDLMEDPWTSINIYFDLDDDHGTERRLSIDVAADGSLFAEVQNTRTGFIRGYGKAWRPNDTSLRVQLPPRVLADGTRGFRWYVRSAFHQESHPDCGTVDDFVLICPDRAPDTRWIVRSGWIVCTVGARGSSTAIGC